MSMAAGQRELGSVPSDLEGTLKFRICDITFHRVINRKIDFNEHNIYEQTA